MIAERVTTMMLAPALWALALDFKVVGRRRGLGGGYGFVKGEMNWNSFETREQSVLVVGLGGVEEERGQGDQLTPELS